MTDSAMRPQEVRRINRRVVLEQLRHAGGTSRAQLSEITSLTPQALGPILAELVSEGLVREARGDARRPGRPPAVYSIDPDGQHRLAIAAARWVVGYAWYDAVGREVAGDEFTVSGDRPAAELLGDVVEQAVALRPDSTAPVEVVGLAIEGLVHDRLGVVERALCWPDRDVPVTELLGRLASAPVQVTSYSRAGARAVIEHYAPADDQLVAVLEFSNLVSLVLARGVNLVTNASGRTMTLAHLPLPGNDLPCECGRVGCLRTVVGGPGVVDRYHELSGNRVGSVLQVMQCASRGDRHAIEAMDDVADRVIAVAGPVLASLRPDLVVVNGATGRPGSRGVESLLERLRRAVAADLPGVEVVGSPYARNETVLRGAVLPHLAA